MLGMANGAGLGMANLPFTYEELQVAVEDKRVTKRPHPTLPYDIYNYTDEVQYLHIWDDITRNCRGLIVDRAGNVIKRPWQKFFNLGQENLHFQFTDPVEVMDKADGSLGILYPWDGAYAIATRGSFNSDQAAHATKTWMRYYHEYYNDPAEQSYMDEFTLLFEIIYPANRVVLSYGDMDDLILLGSVETATGYYFGPRETAAMFAWPGPVVEVYDYNTLTDAIAHMGRKNKEGYVIRRGNYLVKIKEPDYLDLHRLVTNLSSKSVWEKLKAGMSAEKIIASFPDEFQDDVKGFVFPLLDRFAERAQEVTTKYFNYINLTFSDGHDPKEPGYRKLFATMVKDDKDARYMFCMLDGKPITDVLWSELKPREDAHELRETASAD